MRKAVITLTLILFTSLVAASLDADIQPSSPDNITLSPDNDYEVFKEFDGTNSDGDIGSYDWTLVDTDQSASGPLANFTFDRSVSGTSEIRLVVSDDTYSDLDSVTQRVHDVPEVTISMDDAEAGTGEETDFSVDSYENSFDDPVEFEWEVDGEVEGGDEESFAHEFTESGEHTVTVTATDNAGYEGSDSIDVDVVSDHVTITGTNSPIDPGETLEVDVEVGGVEGYDTDDELVLEVDGDEEDSEDVELEEGDTYETTLEWDTEDGDEGDYDIEVLYDGFSDTTEVEVGDEDGDESDLDAFPHQDDEEDEEDEPEFDEVKTIGANSMVPAEISFSESPVTHVTVSVSEPVDGELGSTATETQPSGVSDPGDEVYRYIEYDPDFDTSAVEEVEFEFDVSQGWLDDNDVSSATVELQRYDSGWTVLDAERVDEDELNVYYEATSPGLSVFSITGETWSDLFQVTDIDVNETDVMAGEAVEFNVTVENTGPESGIYELEVDIDGDTESEEVELGSGENTALSFVTDFEETGTKTVESKGETVEVEVHGEGLPWLMIFGGLFTAVLAVLGFIFFPDIKNAAESVIPSEIGDISVSQPSMSGRLNIGDVLGDLMPDEDERSGGYSFEGFGDDSKRS